MAPGGVHGPVEVGDHERVQERVQPLDPGDRVEDQVHRPQLPGVDERGLRHGVAVARHQLGVRGGHQGSRQAGIESEWPVGVSVWPCGS